MIPCPHGYRGSSVPPGTSSGAARTASIERGRSIGKRPRAGIRPMSASTQAAPETPKLPVSASQCSTMPVSTAARSRSTSRISGQAARIL